jgi:5-methylcytosine-specific restriction endonuclease McrA
MANPNRDDDPEYSKFRAKVLKRDKNRCQMPGCKKKRCKLEVHHIIPYGVSQALRTDPTNGISLCVGCHKSIRRKEFYYVQLFSNIVRRNTK